MAGDRLLFILVSPPPLLLPLSFDIPPPPPLYCQLLYIFPDDFDLFFNFEGDEISPVLLRGNLRGREGGREGRWLIEKG